MCYYTNSGADGQCIRHESWYPPRPKSWHKRIISRLTFRAALVSDCCRAPQPTHNNIKSGAVVVVCAMAETKRHLSPEGEIHTRTSPLTNEVCIGHYIYGEHKNKREKEKRGIFWRIFLSRTCWLVVVGIRVDPPLLLLCPPPAVVINMDFMPFLRALSSPSTMSPIRMLTRAYSISDMKTKTVQPDMNTSIA